MKTFSKCKLALIVTLSNATLTVTSSSCSTTWILAVRVLLRRKDIKVSLMTKRNTESIEIEKWLKKAIAGDFLCALGEAMLFVDSKVS